MIELRSLIVSIVMKMNEINRCIFLYTQKKIYVKQGFDKYEKKKNYSIDNYSEEIWDGDLQCIDMYYYSKELKKMEQ